jgi:hypothetical protein
MTCGGFQQQGKNLAKRLPTLLTIRMLSRPLLRRPDTLFSAAC